jgi:uncharacterized protein
LPRQVDPRKLVTQGATFDGPVPTASMMRLAGAVMSSEEMAQAELSFGRDDEGRAVVTGRVQLGVDLECQRCLKPVPCKLSGEVGLGIVWDEERAKALPKHLEPWIVESEAGDLYDMVEDELLLALPIAAYHDTDECRASGSYSTGEVSDSAENPFGILAQLKTRQ